MTQTFLHIRSRKYSKHYYAAILAAIVLVSLLIFQTNVAVAASLTTLSDTMSSLTASGASNHDIKYRTPTGMSSGTMKIYFNTAGFSSGSVDYTDIDLQYGSSSAEVNGSCSSNCTKATLANSAGAGAWGASFTSNDLTFSYPTSGGTAVAGNDYVRVLIGTNASEGATGDQQMSNPGSTGTKTISIDVDTGPSDTGQLAVVIITSSQQTVGTTIDPQLTFAITESSITLTKSGGGNPDYNNTGFNNGSANTLSASTNAASGYSITYYGDTLKSGGNSISAMGTKTTSQTNTSQFGLNLKDNATPNTGSDPSGGSGAAESDYDTADQFRYIVNTTTPLASASAATLSTTYTLSYIVNITQATPAGAYSTTVTYICTGNF